jgi:membrane associated rhomboid family serine protease
MPATDPLPSAPPLFPGEEDDAAYRRSSAALFSAPDFVAGGGAPRRPSRAQSSSFIVDSSSVTVEHPLAYAEPLLEAEPGMAVARPASSRRANYRTGRARPAPTTARRDVSRHYSPIFCIAIVLACTVIFVLEMKVSEFAFAPFHDNPLFGPRAAVLIRCGAKLDCLIEDYGQFWRVITPMWLHAGILHVVCNMGAVIQLGFPLEREYGWRKIGPLYMFGGLMGTLASILVLPNSIMVGASGAVFALLGASWADWLLHIRECRSFISLFIVTVFNLALGLTPLLDNFAHCGGFVAGVLWGLVYLRKENGSCLGFTALFVASLITLAALIAVVAKVHLDVLCPECTKINCIPTPWWGCAEQEAYGPCAATWDQRSETLNLVCGADNSTHYIQNITSVPDQEVLLIECGVACSGLCWGA